MYVSNSTQKITAREENRLFENLAKEYRLQSKTKQKADLTGADESLMKEESSIPLCRLMTEFLPTARGEEPYRRVVVTPNRR